MISNTGLIKTKNASEKEFVLANRPRTIITFGLIAFIVFVVWFGSPASALSVIVNSPNSGETWLQGTTHAIDFNVLTGANQTDFNTSIIAQAYYSKIAGARENVKQRPQVGIIGKIPKRLD